MRRALLCALAACFSLAAHAAPGRPLDDEALSQVSGGDGISFAVHLELNQAVAGAPAGDSRLTIGHQVDGTTSYIVLKNLSGIIDLAAITLTARSEADGFSYVALGLPSYVRFTNVGIDSLSVQADPMGPVTQSLGRFTLNGTMSMQGELRFWPH